ncbi:MAG: Wzz/FepE/Etk N-terminal domain-containing protein [Pseudomonadota bacterium]
MTEANGESYDHGGVGLIELFDDVWRSKLFVIVGTSVIAVIAILVSLSMENIYRAEALLISNEKQSSTGLAGLQGQYGALASLAGIDLGADGSDGLQAGLAVLSSKKFVFDFIDRRELLVPLMAGKSWDAATQTLVIDNEIYDQELNKWIRDVRPGRSVVPTLQEAYEEFTDRFSFSKNDETGLMRLAFESVSPVMSKQWVDWLVEDINQTILAQDVSRAERAIEYLNEQIRSTPLTELKSVLFRLVEDQTRTLMLARISDEYLLRTIDPAIVPEKKVKPVRSIIVLAAVFFGGGFLALIVIVRGIIRRQRS